MDSAVSRRDLHTAISSAGSDSDGLAPPSMIAEDMGSISMRKHWDCFAYVLRSDHHHQALGRMKIIISISLKFGPVGVVQAYKVRVQYKKPTSCRDHL
jgi:hypothetical protein